jgi:hypothetical protein
LLLIAAVAMAGHTVPQHRRLPYLPSWHTKLLRLTINLHQLYDTHWVTSFTTHHIITKALFTLFLRLFTQVQ